MNPRTVIVVVLALVFGLMAAVLVSMTANPAPTAEVEKVTIVCAKEDIPAQAEIKQTMLEEVEFPANMQPTDAFFKSISEVVNPKNKPISKYPIYKGDWITAKKLADKKGIKSLLDTGKRAYSIPVSQDAEIAGGFIEPADKVDVLLTLDSEEDGGAITSTLLQNVSVLAVGDVYTAATSTEDTTKKGAEKKVRNVTLMVTPEQANELQLGATQGTLALALRGQNDNGNATPTPATVSKLKGKTAPAAEASPTAPDNTEIAAIQREIDELKKLLEEGNGSGAPELATVNTPKIEKPTYLTIQLLRGTAMSEVRIRKPNTKSN